MLPKLLTENLCSLRSKVDRLSFSTIFEFDKKSLELIKTDYCKTIINSKHSFTYEDA
jgi:exoribonuclease R